MEEDFEEALNLILVSYDNYTEGFAEHFEFKNLQNIQILVVNIVILKIIILFFLDILDTYVYKFLDID